MSTYTASLLKVGTLDATGESAQLQANTVTVTNLTSTNLNARNFTLSNNFDISGNLTVRGKTSSLDVSGNLAVSGTTTLNALSINNSASILNNLDISGNLNVYGTITAANLSSTPPPNVVIIVTDDLPFNNVSCYGGATMPSGLGGSHTLVPGEPIVYTKNIDALAAGGLRYTNFFNKGYCSPTRASLQTGMDPTDVGVTSVRLITQFFYSQPIGGENLQGYEGMLLKENNTLGELAKAGGYDTFISGKWHLGDPAVYNQIVDAKGITIQRGSDFPTARGYDYWTAAFTGGLTNPLNPTKINNYFPQIYTEGDYVIQPDVAGSVPGPQSNPALRWKRTVNKSKFQNTKVNPLLLTDPASIADTSSFWFAARFVDPSGTYNIAGAPLSSKPYFKDGSNFPWIPQTPGTAGNMDGSGFMYHNTDDCVYSFTDRLTKRVDKTKPFFANINFGAIHSPVADTPYYIRKFWTNYPEEPTKDTCIFMNLGWDWYRAAVLNGMIAKRTITRPTDIPAKSKWVSDWVNLSPQEKIDSAKNMALQAAMTIHMDDAVGNLVQYLKDNDSFDNTLIMFMSDNGGSAEFAEIGNRSVPNGDSAAATIDYPGQPQYWGDENSMIQPGWGWSEICNAPFRITKGTPNKGGVQSPFIVSWPNGMPIARNNTVVSQYAWVEDIFPTLMEIIKPTDISDPVADASANRSSKFNLYQKYVKYTAPGGNTTFYSGGKSYIADLPTIKGTSILPMIKGDSPNIQIYRSSPEVSDVSFYCGTTVTWGNWQIIRDWGKYGFLEDNDEYGEWRLYNTISDPYQNNNVVADYPEKLKEMIGYFNDWVEQQNTNPYGQSNIYSIANYVKKLGNKLSNMLDINIVNQLIQDGSSSFFNPDGSGYIFQPHIYDPSWNIPDQTILKALKAESTMHGQVPVVNDGSAQGMFAGNVAANGRLTDPHFESTLLVSNSGYCGICLDWDGSFNRTDPKLPMLTYMYDDFMRVVIYANQGMTFFDNKDLSGNWSIKTDYAYSSDSSANNYDPLMQTDSSSVCYGRARLVFDLPYLNMFDHDSSGYYLGDGYNGGVYENGYTLTESSGYTTLDISGNQVFARWDTSNSVIDKVAAALGLRTNSPLPPIVNKKVLLLTTGAELLQNYNSTLSKNFRFSNTQSVASSVGFAVRFNVDATQTIKITESLNLGCEADLAFGPFQLSLIGLPNYNVPVSFETQFMPQKVDTSRFPYGTLNTVSRSVSKFVNDLPGGSGKALGMKNGDMNFIFYHQDRKDIPILMANGLAVNNDMEGKWSGMYVTDGNDIFLNSIPANAKFTSFGFQIDRNQTHKYYPSNLIQMPYIKAGQNTGVTLTIPPFGVCNIQIPKFVL